MKKINIFLTALTALALISCSKETVEIDSLQVLGDEFFQGQQVNVGMAVKTSNPDKNYYYWYCDAGSFPAAQQGYPVNKWTAPKANGEYTIGCTVTCGGESSTREIKVKVTGLFFDRFSGNKLATSWSATNQTAILRYGRLETNVSTTRTDSLGFLTCGLGLAAAYPPVSSTADLGIVEGMNPAFTPSYPVSSPAHPNWDNFMSVGFTGKSPDSSIPTTFYINEIRFDWWPTQHMLASVPYFSPDDDYEEHFKDASTFDVRLVCTYTRKSDTSVGIDTYSGTFQVFFSTVDLKFGPDVTRNVAMSISEDYIVKLYAGQSEICSSDAVKIWRESHDNAALTINQFKYIYPSVTKVFMDNLVVNNGVELLY